MVLTSKIQGEGGIPLRGTRLDPRNIIEDIEQKVQGEDWLKKRMHGAEP